MAGEFLDTNVLVYAFTTDPRAVVAQALLEHNCIISVQVLNEFVNVARRKLRRSWDKIRADIGAIRVLCRTVLPIDLDTHTAALRLAERHGFAIFDALMIAAALQAGATTLWSEDLHDGMVIAGKLRIANPFRAEG